MAAPMELFCWAGGWGLPSVDPDCLAVLTYARFTGAPLKVHRVCSPWRSPSGHLPALKTSDGGVISKAQQIIAHLRKQCRAAVEPPAVQGADTLAFMALLEEKLLPVVTHTFWLDAPNYSHCTRRWFALNAPFPHNFLLPSRMQRRHRQRLQMLWGGDGSGEERERLEKELYRDACECLTLLSQRLGSQRFFFGDSPASLDAVVFSRLAPLLKAKLPNGKLQQHLRALQNLCEHSSTILSLYFPWDGGDAPSSAPRAAVPEGGDADEDPHKRRSQMLSALLALAAMLGYAVLSGIVAVRGGTAGRPGGAVGGGGGEEEEEEEE